jgi:hypothetical protein
MTMEETPDITRYTTTLHIEGYANPSDMVKYRARTDALEEKLDSLIERLLGLRLNITALSDYLNVSAIRAVIGVYHITSKEERDRMGDCKMVWAKEIDDAKAESFEGEYIGYYWEDWLGDFFMFDWGGKVVVSLSDEGIEYLNGVASKISSSYTTT